MVGALRYSNRYQFTHEGLPFFLCLEAEGHHSSFLEAEVELLGVLQVPYGVEDIEGKSLPRSSGKKRGWQITPHEALSRRKVRYWSRLNK